ncbi:MAG: dNTP triphosphohydrolase [Lentisphaeria bacterium]|jgi:dGTPase
MIPPQPPEPLLPPQPGDEERLAPWAMRAAESRGRRHPEPPHPFRSPFQRDRDRIIHCRAFRRLDGKTQVFLNGTGDHYRTRLTHTIEVAAIARTLARGLRLNEDLAEAVSLAHDLGHTPFGHMGERVLNELLPGGFDHNAQSLRVVDRLERKYPGIEGLNLTWEVRRGLLKHAAAGGTLDGIPVEAPPSLEAQAAHIADDIAYCTHDLDDGLESGLLTPAMLDGLELWRRARETALGQGGDPSAGSFLTFVVRCLVDLLVEDGLQHSAASLARAGRAGTVGLSPALQPLVAQLAERLFQRLYRHPEVMAVNRRAGDVVRRLFRHFTGHPEELGESARQRAVGEGPARAAADYLAGMTDRYALRLDKDLKLRRHRPAPHEDAAAHLLTPLLPFLDE